MAPKVSIVTPAYNAAGFIGRAIESAQAQTLTDWEMIIVNDASTDTTAQIVKSYAHQDLRIKLINHEKNSGAGVARNTALNAAAGDWIAILDADDTYTPSRLEAMVAAGEGMNLDIVADNLFIIDPAHGQVTRIAFPDNGQPRPFNLLELFRNNMPASGFVYGLLKPVMRRKFLTDANLNYRHFRFAQDFMLYAEIFLHGAKGLLLPTPMYYYTLPQSEINGTKSANTRTPMKTQILIDGSDFLLTTYGHKMSPAEKKALARRRFYLGGRDAAQAFKTCYWNKDYFGALRLLLTNPLVGMYILRGIMWRLLKSSAPSAKQ